ITRAVLHAPREALGEVDDAFDEVVVVSDGRPLEPCARPVTLVVPLVLGIDPADVGRAAAGATRVVLTWPFLAERRHPASGLPHLLSEIRPFLDDLGISWSVKGVPGCVLGPHQGRHARTRNRWYVDSAHQMGLARLFFPDVLQFSKYDVCRFCLLDERCDGVTAKPGDPRPDVSVSPVVDS
ncbi:MAG TPA: hypothetical protein PKA64_04065, partial [Myxococcota bacterium]|nr:hypothetical protein [Myxococcota bacterium]